MTSPSEYNHRLKSRPAAIRVAVITGTAFKKLDEGMPKEDVLRLLGKPDGFHRDGNTETLTYANRLMSGFRMERSDYFVTLTDGKVSGYGNGEIRNPLSNTLIVKPAPPSR